MKCPHCWNIIESDEVRRTGCCPYCHEIIRPLNRKQAKKLKKNRRLFSEDDTERWENIGGRIKELSKRWCSVLTVVYSLVGFGLIIQALVSPIPIIITDINGVAKVLLVLFFIALLAGFGYLIISLASSIAWTTVMLLYAFGDLVENTKRIADKLDGK